MCTRLGHGKIHESSRLFALLVDKLAKAAARRAERDPIVAASGYVVNTADLDKDMVVSVAAQFEIDVVVVLDNERTSRTYIPRIPLKKKGKKRRKRGGERARARESETDTQIETETE